MSFFATKDYSSFLHYYFSPNGKQNLSLDVDICVYGGNSGGVIAAISAKRQGLSAVLLEPGRHLGGMTTGGLSFTDIGQKRAIGGLAREFYRRLGEHYGQAENWCFEPHVAEHIFEEWLQEEKISCYRMSFLDRVEMQSGRIASLTTEHGISVTAKQFIDTSYEGDLMAKAGVSYTVGRESNSTYGESYNGEQVLEKHQFELPVDPYCIEGRPKSGLLPGIDSEPYVKGQGDRRVQAYNFRLCLTDNPNNRIPFAKPSQYDRSHYELLARYCRAGYVPTFSKFDAIAGQKVDMNNSGAVSSDFIGQNHRFPEANYAERETIFQEHVQWTLGLLWFWSTDPAVPSLFQDKVRNWGWCRDEFTETSGFSQSLYVREARRLVGDVVMTEKHCLGEARVEDSVGLAAYTMDSHNCRRVVIDGVVKNDGDVQIHSGPPYSISYRSIIPRRGECRNLFVPFCLSASHISFGSIRMEPVFMILSESASIAAGLSIQKQVDVQQVPYGPLRERLLAASQILDPFKETTI